MKVQYFHVKLSFFLLNSLPTTVEKPCSSPRSTVWGVSKHCTWSGILGSWILQRICGNFELNEFWLSSPTYSQRSTYMAIPRANQLSWTSIVPKGKVSLVRSPLFHKNPGWWIIPMYSAAVRICVVCFPEVWVGFSHVPIIRISWMKEARAEHADATVHEIKIGPQCITRTTLKKTSLSKKTCQSCHDSNELNQPMISNQQKLVILPRVWLPWHRVFVHIFHFQYLRHQKPCSSQGRSVDLTSLWRLVFEMGHVVAKNRGCVRDVWFQSNLFFNQISWEDDPIWLEQNTSFLNNFMVALTWFLEYPNGFLEYPQKLLVDEPNLSCIECQIFFVTNWLEKAGPAPPQPPPGRVVWRWKFI